ncbi:MAG: hypothetical protein LBL04_11295 [Bacteroidales bacterium]|jgi:hypothetical protein|nr:hypothetical protein [Bacteroidales bacterium]
MVYWSELYREIAERITANLKHVKWVDLWHDQVSYLTEELPFPTPAVFIGFNTAGTDDTGKKVQQCSTQIDMYLFYETFSDTYSGSYNQEQALEFLEELTRLHALFHGKSGVNCSAMRRTDMNREESGGAGNLYRISFECLVTDYSAQELFAELENPDVELVVGDEDIPPAGVADEEPMFDTGQ